ncbi:glycosyltransferase family 29 protein [Paraneptunicella aestuarii]|uniref:glycosyltransferase family 29 protein n=1 Tax=Paraneptunicella aestuarii TaxID=2831148 RepID=UPI001E2E90B2|nr:glycosyltransferase family 29 protein [Paraneptunicella aestuarii]UAA39462.1 glycosyltransferase family 29 protein [Paraneptunicella aestuarii]
MDKLAKSKWVCICYFYILKMLPGSVLSYLIKRSPVLCALALELVRTISRFKAIPEKLLDIFLREQAILPSYGIVSIAGLFLQKGNIEKARDLIQSSLHRDDLNACIKKNVSVSSMMHEDLALDDEVNLYKSMLESDTYTSFCQYLKDSSIVVVGNSPCELGKGKGKSIDQYDVVMRFNNFNLGIEEHRADYGSKTSVWVHSGVVDVVFDPAVVDAVDYVVFTQEMHYLSWAHLQTVLELYRYAPDKVVFFPGEVCRTIYSYLPLLLPSSGIKVLSWLTLNNLKFKYCGFKLIDQVEGTRKYYFNQKTQQGTCHIWYKEARVLSKISGVL